MGFHPFIFPDPDPFVLNRDAYIPVGILRKRTGQSTNTLAADHRDDNYPEAEIRSLEESQWIWTSVYEYHRFPDWSFVRVYVLPDDRGRIEIPRSSTALRRALKVVMSRIDPRPHAWSGYLPENWDQNQNLNRMASGNPQDESLWYIFNTLTNPEPQVEEMRNPYARKAMQALLSPPVPSDSGEDGEPVPAVPAVMGLKTHLHAYQRRSAATMVQREAQPAQMLDPRLQLYTTPTRQEYYYDKEEGSIVRERRMYSEACGGMLIYCLLVVLAKL